MSAGVERAAASMYQGLWAALVQWFRVPHEPPTLPVRPGEQIESFRPAPGYLGYLKFWFWLVLLASDVVFAVLYIIAAVALIIEGLWWVALLLLPVALFIIIAPDIVAYVAIHLRYDTMWYVMTDRSMRLRRGIWIITEHTITFENVQNVKVTQGPVQRHFGIADVVVETAGGGGGAGKPGHSSGGHQGVLAGVADAPRLRDLILARVRRSTSAGLGDERHAPRTAAPVAAPAWTPEHLSALREIRQEIAAFNPGT